MPAALGVRTGWLRVAVPEQQAPLQVIELEVSLPRGELALILEDLDGDGHVDLIFEDNYSGSAGPEVGSDVFLWQVGEQRFVKDPLLSRVGTLTSAHRKGCVVAQLPCRDRGWVPRTLCNTGRPGGWHDISPGQCKQP